jgi:hypothetical protein
VSLPPVWGCSLGPPHRRLVSTTGRESAADSDRGGMVHGLDRCCPASPAPSRWEPVGDDAEACRVCRWPVESVWFGAADPGGDRRRAGASGAGLAAPLGGHLRWGGTGAGGASPRPRWPCPTTRGGRWVGQACRTAATSGCWSSSTPGSPRRVGRGSGPPCPTGWPWSSHRAATPSWSASCTPTTRPRAAQPLAAGRP